VLLCLSAAAAAAAAAAVVVLVVVVVSFFQVCPWPLSSKEGLIPTRGSLLMGIGRRWLQEAQQSCYRPSQQDDGWDSCH
jgi:hypothetical protein